jgi:hypothetical protein
MSQSVSRANQAAETTSLPSTNQLRGIGSASMFFAIPSVYSRPKTNATMTEIMMSPPMAPISTMNGRKAGQSVAPRQLFCRAVAVRLTSAWPLQS